MHPALPTAIEETGKFQQEHYSPPRMLPGGINRPRLYTEFNGSDQYGFRPTSSPRASYPPGEHVYHQGNKRHKVGPEAPSMMHTTSRLHPMDPRVYAPRPSSNFGFYHDNVNVCVTASDESEARPARPNTDQHSRLLWLPEDKHHLTELHCFIRKHCVYIFPATSHDVDSESKTHTYDVAMFDGPTASSHGSLSCTILQLPGKDERRH